MPTPLGGTVIPDICWGNPQPRDYSPRQSTRQKTTRLIKSEYNIHAGVEAPQELERLTTNGSRGKQPSCKKWSSVKTQQCDEAGWLSDKPGGPGNRRPALTPYKSVSMGMWTRGEGWLWGCDATLNHLTSCFWGHSSGGAANG